MLKKCEGFDKNRTLSILQVVQLVENQQRGLQLEQDRRNL